MLAAEDRRAVRIPPGTRYTNVSDDFVVVFYGNSNSEPVTAFDVVGSA